MEKDPLLGERTGDHLGEISEYIMKRLSNCILSNKKASEKDNEFFLKVCLLQDMNPSYFEIPPSLYNSDVLEISINLLRLYDKSKTPREKLNCIIDSFNTLSTAYALSNEKGEAASADVMLQLFSYIVLKAKLERSWTNLMFIKSFLYIDGEFFGENAYCLGKLEITFELLSRLAQNAGPSDGGNSEFVMNVMESSLKNENFFSSVRDISSTRLTRTASFLQ